MDEQTDYRSLLISSSYCYTFDSIVLQWVTTNGRLGISYIDSHQYIYIYIFFFNNIFKEQWIGGTASIQIMEGDEVTLPLQLDELLQMDEHKHHQ